MNRHPRLTAAEYARAATWNLVIAGELLGKGTPYRDEGKERKWGPITICRQTGAWYDFAAATGGISSAKLIQFLKKRAGEEWSFPDAEAWLIRFLAEHPGTGKLEAGGDDDWTQTRQAASAAIARHHIDTTEPLDGIEVTYLTSRGLPGPYPEALRRVASARPGESAILTPLISNGRTTGILLTYIDALGTKSLVEPARQRFNIEPGHPGAVIEIAAADRSVIDIAADVVVVEGLENGLSLLLARQAAGSHWRLVALPGISALKHFPTRKGERIIVFQDSDPEDSPAQLGLQAGIDALLLAGAKVHKTEDSQHGDANAILQAEGGGVGELKRLIACAGSAPLSFEGRVEELSRFPETKYMKERKKAARGLEVPVAYLDKEVRGRRPRPPKADEGSTGPSIVLPVDPPWTGATPQLGLLLDRMVKEIRRYVILAEWQARIVAIWAVLTYFVFDPRIDLQVMPRLAIQSATINSGKTALLRIVCTLVRHGKLYGRATSAGIYRALSQAELTLCLDEVEFLRSDPYSPMMQVLDSSHHREDANILLTEPQKFGPPIARELSTWAAMALACNGQLPGSLQSRSIVLILLRALPDEQHESLEKRSTPELVGLRRELTAWAATIGELPRPPRSEMPAEVYNRDGDNWRPVFAIARLAGGDWPDRIKEASLQSLQTETLPTLITRLLSSIDLAFGDNPKPDKWLDTGTLAAQLIAQEGEQWGTINRGKPVDAYWLREHLRGLLHPPGAQEWQEPLADGRRRHHRGYFYDQFADALRRYEQDKLGTFTPGEIHTEGTPESSGSSGTAGTVPKKSKETAEFSVPDTVPDDFAGPGQKKAKKTAADEASGPLVPDEPDDSRGSAVCIPDADERGGAAGSVGVAMMITQAQKRSLRALGYSDAEIREMRPEDAQRLLGLSSAAESEDTSAAVDEWGWLDGAERVTADGSSTAEPSNSAENLDPTPPTKARPTARPSRVAAKPRRAKVNGRVPSPVAKTQLAPELDPPEPSLIDFIEGSIAAEIRQLHAVNPQRSLKWIAKASGQSPSVVREVLGNGEGSE